MRLIAQRGKELNMTLSAPCSEYDANSPVWLNTRLSAPCIEHEANIPAWLYMRLFSLALKRKEQFTSASLQWQIQHRQRWRKCPTAKIHPKIIEISSIMTSQSTFNQKGERNKFKKILTPKNGLNDIVSGGRRTDTNGSNAMTRRRLFGYH